MHPLERLLNLVAMLLEARRPLTFEQIREALPAYAQDDVATAKRMFERDKDILRDNGIPIELAALDAFDVEEGYVIPKDRYYLPEIEFTPQEISALFVAARSGGADEAPAERAVRKLLYGVGGGVLAAGAPGAPAAGPDVDSELLTAAADAVLRGSRRLSFAYTTARGSSSRRRVDAYGLVWRAGRWYLVGLDEDRGEIRAFRLSRIDGGLDDAGDGSAPPEAFRARDHVDVGPWGPGEPTDHVVVSFAPSVAWWAASEVEGASAGEPDEHGWISVAVPAGPDDSIATWILGFGSDARVLEPPGLREEVVRRLEALLAG
jgi:proteasome accessory factor B